MIRTKLPAAVAATVLLMTLSACAAPLGTAKSPSAAEERAAAATAEPSVTEERNTAAVEGTAAGKNTAAVESTAAGKNTAVGRNTAAEKNTAEGRNTAAEKSTAVGKNTAAERMTAEIPADRVIAGQNGASEDNPKEDVLLTSAPPIGLSDLLSSTVSQFTVQSGNYSWTSLDGEDVQEIVACGSYPLDIDPEKAHKLKIPDYNGLESVSYSVSCSAPPDRLTVREWDISQIGNPEAVENSSVTYEEVLFIKLKPDKVYEILAVWDREKLEENRFCGTACYVVLTESIKR